jgi:hypothetical protein
MTVAPTIRTIRAFGGALAGALVSLAALGAVGACLGAAAGLLPWLSLTVTAGEAALPWAGIALQILLTTVLVAIAAMVPAMLRVARLEASHRNFAVGMEDVARAYHLAHSADRAGVYRLRHEFDAVRERIAHLREHPDLDGIEHDVLELAAQMSTQTRRLAKTYSDDAVDRARRFLQQRQEEVERTREAIAKARYAAREIGRWSEAVGLEEAAVEGELRSLEADLEDVLPQLGFERSGTGANVVRMPATAAE